MAASPVKPSDLKALLFSATATLCDGFTKALLQIPVAVYKIIAWMLDSDGNLSADFLSQIIPPGDLKWSAVVTPATGWLLCDGTAVSRTTYAALFTAIGTIYGPGDGVNTFNLPDARAKFLVGVGTFDSGTTVAIGETGGEDKHVLTGEEFVGPDHIHAFGKMDSDSGDPADDATFVKGTASPALTGTGRGVNGVAGGIQNNDFADQTGADLMTDEVDHATLNIVDDAPVMEGHNNLPPYLGTYLFIKT